MKKTKSRVKNERKKGTEADHVKNDKLLVRGI
jgi:hypothetical protein